MLHVMLHVTAFHMMVVSLGLWRHCWKWRYGNGLLRLVGVLSLLSAYLHICIYMAWWSGIVDSMLASINVGPG